MGEFTIKIVNDSGDADQLYLLLTVSGTNIGFDGGGILKVGEAVTVADFFSGVASHSFSAEVLDGCRLYVGYGEMQPSPAPDPNSNQFYGWIEFSKTSESDGLWINLSNVDILGMPLALDGTLAAGGSFSLGYKKSQQDIVAELEAQALTSNNPAVVKDCGGGKTKIVAPNIQFPFYRSYQPYLDAMTAATAKLTIHTDTPIGAPAKVFKGSFLQAASESDPIISLTSGTDTFEILKSQFDTEYLYRCDGGTTIYNGQTVNMNRNDDGGHNADVVYTNSLFRNLCVGINEGYFTPTGENDSSKFSSDTPFTDGRGNVYAKIIHETSNSYGFPYADGNLKTLIEAGGDSTVTMTIMTDTEAGHYQS
ncbi:MAG: beta-1,3-glucanase family protein [Pseudomonadota bacterium]